MPEVLSRMGLKKALVCSDKGLIKVGTTKMVTDVLDEVAFPYEIYSEIKPNPTVTNVQEGVAAFKASGADCLIAIGDVCTPGNPRDVTEAEIIELYKKIL